MSSLIQQPNKSLQFLTTPQRLKILQQCILKTRAANNITTALAPEQLTLLTGVWAETLTEVPTDDLLPAHQYVMRSVAHPRDITALAVLQAWQRNNAQSNLQQAGDYLTVRRPGDDAEL